MKLTKRQLKQLIKEELGEELAGGGPPGDLDPTAKATLLRQQDSDQIKALLDTRQPGQKADVLIKRAVGSRTVKYEIIYS